MRRLKLLILLLVVSITVIGCQDDKFMNLRGNVTDKFTGEPLVGITVEVGNQVVKTNNQGYFIVNNIPVIEDIDGKDSVVRLSGKDYIAKTKQVLLEEGDKSISIQLERNYMNLSGQVIDRFKGESLAGVTVEIGNQLVETDANGYFTIKKIPVIENPTIEDRLVKVSSPGYMVWTKVINLEGKDKLFNEEIALESKREAKFFFVSDKEKSKSIYVTDIYAKNVVKLTDDKGDDWAPNWSADGEQLLFLSNRDGNTNIYVMNADGSNLRQVTFTTTDKESPVWLDKNTILFASNRDGDFDIYKSDLTGTYLQRLTDNNYYDSQIAYSSKYQSIAYISATTGERKLHVMQEDGTAKMLLNSGFGTDSQPAWSGDEEEIIFNNYSSGKSIIYQIAPNGSNLKDIMKVNGRVYNYALWDREEQLILYVSDGIEGREINLFTRKEEKREIISKKKVNYNEPEWQD
ncbi:PD40 domain-containing protein [Orenia metallireducens]|uniref:PD40 domain-containing protein n=1 Tax=Orenia metallireducens TaxID=1413210 RepID=UPI00159EF634|nr:PD40 domain-containing protein [Orenia metallireducens]